MAGVIATTDDPVLRAKFQDEHNTWLRPEYLLGQSVKDLTEGCQGAALTRTSAAALLLVTLTACGGDDAPVRQARPETPTTPVVGPPEGCPSGTVRLTFDDGPDPEVTPRVLDILAAYDAKATFFVVGSAVSENPDIVERAHAEGHSIQNTPGHIRR